MKKWKYLLLIIIGSFFLSACNGTITRELRHDGFNVGSTFTCENFIPTKKDALADQIKYLTNTHIISASGNIYEVSLGQPYANKENCKVADTNLKVKAIFDNNIIKAEDNKYYYLNSKNNVSAYTEVPETDNSYELYNLLLEDEDTIKVVTANNSTGEYYVLKTDGNVYSYTLSKADRNTPLQVTSIVTVYSTSEYGSNIIDFQYAGNNLGTYIRTNDKVFRMRSTNYEECSKYADIACTYNISEDTVLMEYQDNIVTFNGSTLITNYGQVFTVAN